MSTQLALLGVPPLAAHPWSGLPWLLNCAAGAGLLGILLVLVRRITLRNAPQELRALVTREASEAEIRIWLIKKGFRA
jgi:hypothetical protein